MKGPSPTPSVAEAPAGPLIERTEVAISYILRGGVMVSIALVVLGMVLMFVHHHDYVTTALPLEKIPGIAKDFPHSVAEVCASVGQVRGQGFILLGLLVLIATPVMRVAASILAFHFQKDRTFTLVTSVVLLILLLSFFLGKAGG